MPTFSFTYNGDYDLLDKVVLRRNGSDESSGPNNVHAFGPQWLDRFIFNNDSDLSQGGSYFEDANRDQSGSPGYVINKTEYSVSADMSDNTASVYLEGGDFGDILRAGSGADTLKGGSGNNVLEGGAGADKIEGGLGIDTASYEHATGRVYASLEAQMGYEGDANQDTFSGIENLIGSAFDDSLIGDDNNNTLRGNGGEDDFSGLGGDDRIVVSSTPLEIRGGDGKDVLVVEGGGTVSLIERTFTSIETVYVRNDTRLDMTNVLTGNKIVSQSTSGYAVEIVGTAGNDTITAGKSGADNIDGAGGDDRIVMSSTTGSISGGEGKDFLFVQGGGSVILTDETITEIEAVYVRNDTRLDLGGVQTGMTIISQSMSGHGVEILGTSGIDTIKAGKGGDTIDGGKGGDKLVGIGGESDSFRFGADFGRDTIHRLDLNADHIVVDIPGIDATDMVLSPWGGGRHTLVTFVGLEAGNKIILYDTAVDDVRGVQGELFLFGA